MRNISILLTSFLFTLLISHVVPVMAQPAPTPTTVFSALSVRLEQPKSPTNQSSFGIVFVTLDLQKRDVTVTCQKQGPGDGGFMTFGSTQTLTNGGNTGSCIVDSSIFSTSGTYTFRTIAAANGSTATSNEVTVLYNTEGPGDPRDYSKNKISSCEYKIHFRAADDAGKTVKVEIYRSTETSFTANGSSRVHTETVTSNEIRDITVSGDCDKKYYFAIRAFDIAGNGSGIVGDSETQVTITKTSSTISTTTTSTSTSLVPAIEVISSDLAGTGGFDDETKTGEEGKTLGLSTPSGETNGIATTLGEVQGTVKKVVTNPFVIAGVILLIVGLILLYVGRKNQKA